MPTMTTIPLLLLLLLLWRWTRGNVLAIVAFTSIFDAASALNFGALGVSPWLMALAICLPLRIAQGRQRTGIAPGINKPGLYLVIAFYLCEAFSGVVYPFVFAGIPVLHLTDLVPLQWGLPNLAQLCYLAAASVIFMLTITSTRDELNTAFAWYLRGCITATVIAAYQLANAVVHVPYPDALFYSNTGHAIYHAYKINGMWRLNSTFTEASDMAGSIVPGVAMMGWNLMKNRIKLSSLVIFASMLIAVLMTLSTTGYLCLALLAAIAVLGYVRQVAATRGASPSKLLVLVLLFATASTALIASKNVRTQTYKIISSVILNKKDSDSYKAREESHSQALKTLSDTSYLGVGLGSVRASGMAYTILASSGVLGLLLFTLAFLALFLPIMHPARTTSEENKSSAQRTLLSLSMFVTGMVLAGSEPIAPVLWLLFGAALVYPGFADSVPAELSPIYPRHQGRAVPDRLARPDWAESLAVRTTQARHP